VPLPRPALLTTEPDLDAPVMIRRARELAVQAVADAKECAATGGRLVASLFPEWQVETHSVADSPYAALVERAETWRADLVVVGSHGRSAMGRMFLGSVSQNILSYAPCSVRVARSRPGSPPETRGVVRIVLGIDGSPGSAAAAEAVAARAWPAGTEVMVVAAWDLQFELALAQATLAAGRGGRAPESIVRQRIDAVADDLRRAGLHATPVIVQGDPKRVLVEQAEEWDADCIILGAKGHGRVARFLLGSVSAAVAARAHCSVEVVR
jgi:nucleotide-binding universal stress UspA family protein